MNLEIIQAVQRLSNPVLDELFQVLTMFGEKILLAGVFCLIYWCVDKQTGKFLIYALAFSLCLNGLIKDLFRVPRPIGQEGIVSKRIKTATGYSFPSGHTQSAAVFWWGIGRWSGKRKLLVLAGILILGVGFSRIYLGVHYPTDVLGGLIFGILCAEFFLRLMKRPKANFLPVILCALMAVAALSVGVSKDTIVAGGMTLGVIAGDWLERNFVHFQVGNRLIPKLMRFLLGAALVGVCYLAPRHLIGNELLASTTAVTLVAFMGMGGCPWIFKRLKL